MLDITIGSSSSSYQSSRGSDCSDSCTQSPSFACAADGGSVRTAAAQGTDPSEDAMFPGSSHDQGKHHDTRSLGGGSRDVRPLGGGATRSEAGKSPLRDPTVEGQETHSPPPQCQPPDEVAYLLSNRASMSLEQKSPPSLQSFASMLSSLSGVSVSAVHWPSRHAPSLVPYDRGNSGVQRVASLSATTDGHFAAAPNAGSSDRASLLAEDPHRTHDPILPREPGVFVPETFGGAQEPRGGAAVPPVMQPLERGEEGTCAARTAAEISSQMLHIPHRVPAPATCEPRITGESSPDAIEPTARCNPSRVTPLVSPFRECEEEETGNREGSERALRLSPFKGDSRGLLSPSAHSSCIVSGHFSSQLQGFPSSPSSSVPQRQQQRDLQLPPRSLGAVSCQSLTPPVASQEPLGRGGRTDAISLDLCGRGETRLGEHSSRQRTDFHRGAFFGTGNGNDRAGSFFRFSGINGPQLLSQASEKHHRHLSSGETFQDAAYRLLGGGDGGGFCRPGDAQWSGSVQPLSGSPEASPAPCGHRSIEGAGGDKATGNEKNGAEPRLPRCGAHFFDPGPSRASLPVDTSTDETVQRERRSDAVTAAVDIPPPLPQAPWRPGDGAFSLDSSLSARGVPMQSRANDVNVVTGQLEADPANEDTAARVGYNGVRLYSEGGEFSVSVPLEGGVASAMEASGLDRGVVQSNGRVQLDPSPKSSVQSQRRAVNRWRSRGSLVGTAAVEVFARSSARHVFSHDQHCTASEKVIECNGSHPSRPRGPGGEAATSSFKGGVHLIPWVPSSVGRVTNISGVSLTPQPMGETPATWTDVHFSDVHRVSTDGSVGSDASPRIVAVPLVAYPYHKPIQEASTLSVLNEVVQDSALAAPATNAKGFGAQASQGGCASSPTPSICPHMRLKVITSSRKASGPTAGERILAIEAASPIARSKRRGHLEWCGDSGSTGGLRWRRDDAHRPQSAAAVQQVHPLQGYPKGQHTSRSRLATELAPRTGNRRSFVERGEGGGAGADKTLRSRGCSWHVVTLDDLVCSDIPLCNTRDDCQRAFGSVITARWGQDPQQSRSFSQTLQSSAELINVLSAHPQKRQANGVHASQCRGFSFEASPLASPVSSTDAMTSDVCVRARQPPGAVTGRVAVVTAAGGEPLPHSRLEPGYAAVYSPCIFAARVLEKREGFLNSARTAAVVKETAPPSLGSSSASSLHHGPRSAPAVRTTVAVSPFAHKVVQSQLASSFMSPLHAHIDLREDNTGKKAPSKAGAGAVPLSLCLSESPGSEGPSQHSVSRLHQQGRGSEYLHKQTDFPTHSSPHPVARRIPFGLETSAPAEEEPPKTSSASRETDASASLFETSPPIQRGEQYARKISLHSPSNAQRSTTASVHGSLIESQLLTASVDAPSESKPVSLASAAVAPIDPRITSLCKVQARHRRFSSPEPYVTDCAPVARTRAGEDVHQASTKLATSAEKVSLQIGNVVVLHQPRLSHILGQQRLIKEEGFRRRQISMEENHHFMVQMAELNYRRAVDYAHQSSNAASVVASRLLKENLSASLTPDPHREPLVGLVQVRRDQEAMSATLRGLERKVATLSQ